MSIVAGSHGFAQDECILFSSYRCERSSREIGVDSHLSDPRVECAGKVGLPAVRSYTEIELKHDGGAGPCMPDLARTYIVRRVRSRVSTKLAQRNLQNTRKISRLL